MVSRYIARNEKAVTVGTVACDCRIGNCRIEEQKQNTEVTESTQNGHGGPDS
jgi:hypothetical protein